MKAKLFLITLIAALAGSANAQTSGGSSAGGSSGTTSGGSSAGTSTGAGTTTGNNRNSSGTVNSRNTTAPVVGVTPSAGVGTTPTQPRVGVVDSSGQVTPIPPPVSPFTPAGNQNRPVMGVPPGNVVANSNALGMNAFSNQFGGITNQFGLTNAFGMLSNQFGIGSNVTGISPSPFATNRMQPTGRTNGNRILQNPDSNPRATQPGMPPGGGVTQPLPGSNP